MKVYITATYKGVENRKEIENICRIIASAGLEVFCFVRDVERYQKIFSDSHEVMKRALEEISKCDALLIDYDGPATGRMIELGIAYALGKKVIMITRKGNSVKETASGVADIIIEYEELEDIVESLKVYKQEIYASSQLNL